MPKTKSDNRTVEIKMGDKLDIQTYMIMSGIKLKMLYAKNNDYGTNQLSQILDENQLEHICKLAEESLKMPVWKCNEKCYITINDTKLLIMQLINLKLMVTLK